jgi:thiol-disulfide isomerase/thioredoxin
MVSDDRLLSTARRIGHLFHTADVRAGDRGPDDDADVLWPVGDDFSLAGATDWLGSPPLTGADLRGRVVAVNFWTFTCINWLRQLPYVRAWDQAYREHGLVVIGVHSPEFSFEHDVDSVRRAVDVMSIRYPVAVDNRFAVWRSFHNHYWPALYLVGADGRLRHHVFGEGQYEETERTVRDLLAEAGVGDLGPEPAVDGQGIEAAADWDTLRSAETYLGYERTSGFASTPALTPERPRAYSVPERLSLGHWGLSGSWTVGREVASSQEPGGRLTCRFHARDLHLVAGPVAARTEIPFRVLLDGRPPGADHGVDVDASGHGALTGSRL